MDLHDPYTYLWIGWLLAFLGIEGFALARKEKGDTLSEHVWSWFSVKERKGGYKWRRGVLGAFLAWLVAHFMGAPV
jgi:hypothetical protein